MCSTLALLSELRLFAFCQKSLWHWKKNSSVRYITYSLVLFADISSPLSHSRSLRESSMLLLLYRLGSVDAVMSLCAVSANMFTSIYVFDDKKPCEFGSLVVIYTSPPHTKKSFHYFFNFHYQTHPTQKWLRTLALNGLVKPFVNQQYLNDILRESSFTWWSKYECDWLKFAIVCRLYLHVARPSHFLVSLKYFQKRCCLYAAARALISVVSYYFI